MGFSKIFTFRLVQEEDEFCTFQNGIEVEEREW